MVRCSRLQCGSDQEYERTRNQTSPDKKHPIAVIKPKKTATALETLEHKCHPKRLILTAPRNARSLKKFQR
jgi:hypothetical protein